MLVASTGIGFSYDVYGTKVYPSPEMIGKLLPLRPCRWASTGFVRGCGTRSGPGV